MAEQKYATIWAAAEHGTGEDIKALSSKGIDLPHPRTGLHPIHIAASRNDASALKAILELGVHPDRMAQDDTNALHHAALAGSAKAVEALLDAGAAVDCRDFNGLTPLHNAALFERPRCALLLIEKGAAVETEDFECETALGTASRVGSRKTASYLIAKGADVNAQDGYGDTPLHHACARGDRGMVKDLLLKGARIGALDADGQSPLIRLAREAPVAEDTAACVALLVAAGANRTSKAACGKSAEDEGLSTLLAKIQMLEVDMVDKIERKRSVYNARELGPTA
jgi:ankyrin repeat protein